jgi:hypothetical protein
VTTRKHKPLAQCERLTELMQGAKRVVVSPLRPAKSGRHFVCRIFLYQNIVKHRIICYNKLYFFKGGGFMREIANWALTIAFIVFLIDWSVMGLKLLDNN